MRRITGRVLAILLVPTCASAGLADYPADLSKWVRTRPPEVGDDRWFDANQDIGHQWIVFLHRDRPSVRLRSAKRQKGSPYPERQESYPPMPFVIEQGSSADGLAGEWFSTRVSDGWLVGFNAGEWGGAIWWYAPDGKERYKVSTDQVIGFFKTGAGLVAPEGLDKRGRIVRLIKGGNGRWHSEPFVDLGGGPEAAAMGIDGSLTVATEDRLLRIHLDTRGIDVLLKESCWAGLYPNSIILAPSGSVYLGMRHVVVEVKKEGAAYKAKWLIPNPEFDRPPREGIR